MQCMKVVETLKYPAEKIRMILNREECMYAISRAEIEASLKRKFDYSLHDDWKNALSLVNEQKTIFDTTTESAYRNDFIHLITGLTGEKITEEAKKSGLMGAQELVRRQGKRQVEVKLCLPARGCRTPRFLLPSDFP